MGNLKIFKQPKGLPDSTSTSTSDGYLEIKIMRVEVMDQVAWPIGHWYLVAHPKNPVSGSVYPSELNQT